MNIRTILVSSLALALIIAWTTDLRAAWGPDEIHVQGMLTNLADEPVEGPVDLAITLYDGPGEDAAVLFMETHAGVELTAGRFDVLLGAVEDLGTPAVFETNDGVWVGIMVDGGLELPRAPLASVGYAMQARHAVLADSLAVGDCQPGELLSVDEAGTSWACTADLMLTEAEVEAIIADDGYAKVADLATVALSGQYDDLLGLPEFLSDGDDDLLAGITCEAGNVLVWDGAWACGEDQVLSDAEVLAIVEGAGYLQELSLAEVATSGSFEDLTDVPDGLWDGDTDTTYTAGPGLILQGTSFSLNTQAVDALFVSEGEIGAISSQMIQSGAVGDTNITDMHWDKLFAVPGDLADGDDVGLLAEGDPQVNDLAAGMWCTSDGFEVNCLEPPPTIEETDPKVGDLDTDAVPRWDGATLADGVITDTGDAAAIDGPLDMEGNKIADVAMPTAATDAATKGYVDGSLGSIPASTRISRNYTVVLGLNAATHCPAGWTQESYDSLKGPDNNLRLNIHSRGLFMGGMNSPNYGNKQLYVTVGAGKITTICHKTFHTSSDRPHIATEMFKGGDATSCRDGWHYVKATHLRGASNTGYMMANSSGAYMGYVASWSRDSHSSDEQHGYSSRTFTSHVDTVCFKVMGVDEDPDTKNGVFPVYMGVQNEDDCPGGWNVSSTSAMDGSDNYFYLQISDNATYAGGRNGWTNSGGNHLYVYFSYSQVNFVCWNYFPIADAQPFWNIRTPHTGSCPNGYMSFNATAFKGWNGNGYIAATGHGLYMGGLYSWDNRDYGNGWIRHNFTSQVNNKVCLKLENVDQ